MSKAQQGTTKISPFNLSSWFGTWCSLTGFLFLLDDCRPFSLYRRLRSMIGVVCVLKRVGDRCVCVCGCTCGHFLFLASV